LAFDAAPERSGAVGLCSNESEQDAMTQAARRMLKRRKNLFITVRPEIEATRVTAPPKATAMPIANYLRYNHLQKREAPSSSITV
jgi:hypothetical protein